MKVIDMINMINEIIDNMISNDSKVVYINELEQLFYQDVVLELDEIITDLAAEQSEYLIPDPYRFEDIVKVTVSDDVYLKTTALDKDINEYYKTSGGFSITPTPENAEVDKLEIVYRKKPVLKTTDNIQTDDCQIMKDFGERWGTLYQYFLKWKISIDLKEFAEANNWAVLFEEEKGKFYKWYQSAQPNLSNRTVERDW